MGIYFGGVFQTFKFTDTDLKVAPFESLLSNQGYNTITNKEVGGPYDEREIDSSPSPTETDASKVYRNANGDEG